MKKWWQSKTLWINSLTVIGVMIVTLMDNSIIQDNPETVAGLGAALALSNMILRLITNTGVEA